MNPSGPNGPKIEPTNITLFKSFLIASFLCIFETYFFFQISTKDALAGLNYNLNMAAYYLHLSSKDTMTPQQRQYLRDIAENYKKMEVREEKRRKAMNARSFRNAIILATLLIASTIAAGYFSKDYIKPYLAEIGILLFLSLSAIATFQYFFYKNIASKYQYQSKEEILFAMRQYYRAQEDNLKQEN